MGTVLEISGLSYRYPPMKDGEEPTFEVRVPELTLGRGELVALAGASGSGKSTVLDLLGLILACDEAAVFQLTSAAGQTLDLAGPLRAGDLDALADARRDHLGYVLQQGGLLPALTVRQNILVAGARGGHDDGGIDLDAMVERLDIAPLMSRWPHQLSIGQRQRVSIARALIRRPVLVLADEPTAALDPPTASVVLDLLLELAERWGSAVVMANHDWALSEAKGFNQINPIVEKQAGAVVSEFRRQRAA